MPLVNTFQNIVTAIKETDETVNNSDTFQDDDELTVPVLAGKTYSILLFQSIESTAAAGFKTRFKSISGGVTLGERYGLSNSLGDLTDVISIGSPSAPFGLFIRGILITDPDVSGNLSVEWAQVAATAVNTTIKKGSWLRVFEVLG